MFEAVGLYSFALFSRYLGWSRAEIQANASCADARLPPMAAPTTSSFLRTVLVRLRLQPIADPDAPPEGGIIAWSQVLGLHLTVCNTWGYITAFGMFQSVLL
jgi:hypothetical protein